MILNKGQQTFGISRFSNLTFGWWKTLQILKYTRRQFSWQPHQKSWQFAVLRKTAARLQWNAARKHSKKQLLPTWTWEWDKNIWTSEKSCGFEVIVVELELLLQWRHTCSLCGCLNCVWRLTAFRLCAWEGKWQDPRKLVFKNLTPSHIEEWKTGNNVLVSHWHQRSIRQWKKHLLQASRSPN